MLSVCLTVKLFCTVAAVDASFCFQLESDELILLWLDGHARKDKGDNGNIISSGGKSTQLSYLSKSKDTLLIENYSSKSGSHPVKYYLSKSLQV